MYHRGFPPQHLYTTLQQVFGYVHMKYNLPFKNKAFNRLTQSGTFAVCTWSSEGGLRARMLLHTVITEQNTWNFKSRAIEVLWIFGK